MQKYSHRNKKLIEITDELLKRLKNTVYKRVHEWRFNKSDYTKAERESQFPIHNAMGILDEFFLKGKLLTEKEFFKICKRRNPNAFTNEYWLPRAKQFVYGYLREVEAIYRCKEIDVKCKIYKDNSADVGRGGIDFIVEWSNKSVSYFAVRHLSRHSNVERENRKLKKRAPNADILWASKEGRIGDSGKGLDTVLAEDIKKFRTRRIKRQKGIDEIAELGL